MLLLVLILIATINQSNSNLFLIKQYNDYLCLTRTNDALAIITPPKLDSYRVQQANFPNSKIYNYNCDINNQKDNCDYVWMLTPWKIINSLEGDIDDYILDRRWQNLKEIATMYPRNHDLRFNNRIEIKTSNFEIPFSLRTENEAHIYLCDDEDPRRSNCYWFIIEGWNGNRTAVRKCKPSEILNKSETPNGHCADLLVEFSNIGNSFDYITDRKWQHLKLIKRQNQFQLMAMRKPLIVYNDQEKLIDIKFMIIQSRNLNNALWRIHDYQYLWSDREYMDILGPYIRLDPPTTFCASMYIAMCDTCELHLSLFEVASGDTHFKEIYTTKSKGWQEIRYVKSDVEFTYVQLYVETIARDSFSEHFWAIDGFNMCQENEFNSIEISGQDFTACQRIGETDEILNLANIDDSFSENNCTINSRKPTIGNECFPCNFLYYKGCYATKYCQNDNIGRPICTCAAGYYGNNCDTACRYNKYGINCQKSCGNCLSNCNTVDGTCVLCSEGFKGERCDIPDSGAILKNPPTIQDVSYNSCSVKQTDFTLLSDVYNKNEPKYFEIQYRDISDKEWQKGERLDFGNTNSVIIDDLKADTQYSIRSVLLDEFNEYTSDGNYVRETTFKTTCRQITEDSIQVNPSNESATIQILTDKTSCKLQNCRITINKRILTQINGSNIYLADKLTPFSNYSTLIENCGNISPFIVPFKTLEGKPSLVTFVTVTSKTSTTIELQWNKPTYERGIIRHYEVICKYLQSKGCNNPAKPTIVSTIKVNSTTIKLSDLQPYSTYQIQIAAVTILMGNFQTTVVDTQESETVTKEELPYIFRITATANSVQIKFNPPADCKLIYGKLSMKFNGSCINEWCTNSSVNKDGLEYRSDLNILNLLPYSTYNFDIYFCRNQCRKFEPTTVIITKNQRPNNNFDESIYETDTTSISVRFKEPYPPTGEFQDFLIVAFLSRYRRWVTQQTDIIKKSTNKCRLWPDYYCLTFDNLESYTYYKFEISAKNTEPVDYSQVKTIEKYLQIEKPDPPYDLSLNWTIDNQLIVSWKHPNFTSEQSTTFLLRLGNSQTTPITKSISFDRDQYNSTYSYKIESSIMTNTQYRVEMSSKNSVDQSDDVTIIDTSPPPIPSLNSNLQIDFINSTITLRISRTKESILVNSSIKILISNGNHSNIEQRILDRMPEMDLEIHRIITEHIITTNDEEFLIKQDAKGEQLVSTQQYTITVILINQYKNKLRSRIYTEIIPTVVDIIESSDGVLITVLILLCVILILAIVFIVKRKSLQTNLDSFKQRFIINKKDTEEKSDDDELQLTHVPDIKPVVAPKPIIPVEKKPSKENNPEMLAKEWKYSKRIKITDFEDYVKTSIENGELERQHALFPRGKVKSCSYGELKANKSKNRYNNLIAYDHSRVILDKINGDQYSDYINANYIDGYKVAHAYIATQGPKPNTLYDFWRMIWHNNCEYIVMLANVHENGKKKVEKYWPDINEQLQFQDIHIQYLSNRVFADYEMREFQISKDNQQRKIKQLHFMTWPDHGVPLYSRNLVPFLQEMLKMPNSSRSPVVVHCSAGVGRTGTIILCDIALRMAAREGAVDVLNILEMIRSQRSNLVDNFEQYKLAHLVILECLVGMHTSIPCNDIETIVDRWFKENKIKIQMDYLERTLWQDQAMNTVSQSEEAPPIIEAKNRAKDITPEIQGRVYLTRYPVNDETSSYINAVKVDAFRNPGRFIVTQQPLPTTVGDFWRLIIENNVTVIVSLNSIDHNDKTCCEFWPTKDNPEIHPVDFLHLKYTNVRSIDCCNVTTIHIHNDRSNESTPITVDLIAMKNWPSKQKLPKSIDDFLTFWDESDLLCRRSEKVVITCYDGATACGIYVAMCFIIEKMKLEQNCDVCHAVRTIRQNRRQFVQTEAQFRFLYEAAVKYIEVFQSYANFK